MKINSVLLAILLLYFSPSGLIAQNNALVKLVIDGAKN